MHRGISWPHVRWNHFRLRALRSACSKSGRTRSVFWHGSNGGRAPTSAVGVGREIDSRPLRWKSELPTELQEQICCGPFLNQYLQELGLTFTDERLTQLLDSGAYGDLRAAVRYS
jgi:hypothetical protein